jgi:hypothetical protein
LAESRDFLGGGQNDSYPQELTLAPSVFAETPPKGRYTSDSVEKLGFASDAKIHEEFCSILRATGSVG